MNHPRQAGAGIPPMSRTGIQNSEKLIVAEARERRRRPLIPKTRGPSSFLRRWDAGRFLSCRLCLLDIFLKRYLVDEC